MKSRDHGKLALLVGGSVVFAMVLAHSHLAIAQDAAQATAQDPQKADKPATTAADTPNANRFMRRTQTGSNIARVRNDESLPVSEFDRTYIDRTGVATTPELLRTIPYIQVGR